MVPIEKKEAYGSSKTEAQTKALKAKKAVQKRYPKPHTHTKTHTLPIFWGPKTLHLQRQPKYPQKSTPRRYKFACFAIIKFPLTTESAIKIKDNNILVFIVDVCDGLLGR
ncbi:large ribosomal subunit protein uL23-like [Dasypus novemcinctus]|uniref:large ribosomal subunit protein uL23-like n=1 Tax=Dasypus novemcinctus TaxID=9361 RepID=UPI00265F06A9|nr:large ribosomal subunit protein uL23-like [Dasypus novemcinctus]